MIPDVAAAEYYDKIATGYDQLYGEEQIHKAKVILRFMKPSPKESLLDVGCGTAIYAPLFNCRYTGIDPSELLLTIAEQRFKKGTFVLGKAESLPFPKAFFDYVISITAVHHANVKRAIDEIHRVLKPKGKSITNAPKVRCAITVQKSSLKLPDVKKAVHAVFADWRIEEFFDEKDIIFLIS